MTPLGRPLHTQGEEPKEIVLSPDGRILYAGSADGKVRTFDVRASKRLEATELGHDERVKAVAESYDGRWLASLGNDEEVRLWQIKSQPPVGVQLANIGSPASGIALDPTRQRIAVGGTDGKVHVLDTAPGTTTPARTLAGQTGEVFGMAYLNSWRWSRETRRACCAFGIR